MMLVSYYNKQGLCGSLPKDWISIIFQGFIVISREAHDAKHCCV